MEEDSGIKVILTILPDVEIHLGDNKRSHVVVRARKSARKFLVCGAT